MSGIVGSRLNIRGSGLVGSLGTDGQVFTSSGAGAGAVFEDAGGGGAWTYISTTAMDADTILVTGLDTTYDVYMFSFANVHIDEDNATNSIFAHAQQGGSIITSSNYYYAASQGTSGGSALNVYYSGGAVSTGLRLAQNGLGGGAETAEVQDGNLFIYHPGATTHLNAQWTMGGGLINSRWNYLDGWGGVTLAAATTGIQFSLTNGGFDGGNVRLYGINNS